jgi:membrane fusion protein (multidrug efflux system)
MMTLFFSGFNLMITHTELKLFISKHLKHPLFKKRLLSGSLLFLVVTSLWYGIYSHFHVATDDAYVNANIVQIAPQVSGRVTQLYITNNQFVKKDEPLFDIDPWPYEIAVNRARAQLALTRQSVGEKNAAASVAMSEVAMRKAEWLAAKSTAERTIKLVKSKVLSPQTGDNVTAAYQGAAAALEASKAHLREAQITLGTLNDDNPNVQLALANLHDAELNLSYTHVVAAHDGYISNLSLQKGALVSAQHPLFALISNDEFWVDTNLKETDLKNIRPGQSAKVKVDMYPDQTFQGKVESISYGSGAAFSLLPPQNATGNWVKVTQRVPVRVKIISRSKRHPLRVGTSAHVSIRV